MNVIGQCPDCGADIYEGHITHRCLAPVHPNDPSSLKTGFDLVVTRRGDLISNSFATKDYFLRTDED